MIVRFILNVPKLVTFPCLKVLFFKQVEFPGDSLNGILSGCPLLEELVILSCEWEGSDLFFSNPLLKKLTLDVGIGGVVDQHNGSSIHFNLPSLVYLKYGESLRAKYVLNDLIRTLHSLVHAFEVGFNEDELEEHQLCNTTRDVIRGASNCKILCLSGECLEALTRGDFALPVFQNLTRLKLGQACDVGWDNVLPDFLYNSPCLESFTLVQGYYTGWSTDDEPDDESDDDCLLEDRAVFSCVSSCLKVVKLKSFTGSRGEMDMVIYFLEKANVLEQMVIHWRNRNIEMEKEILKLPKASETCSVSFKDTN